MATFILSGLFGQDGADDSMNDEVNSLEGKDCLQREGDSNREADCSFSPGRILILLFRSFTLLQAWFVIVQWDFYL